MCSQHGGWYLTQQVEQGLLSLPARAVALWPETGCELLKQCSEPFELESQFRKSAPPCL